MGSDVLHIVFGHAEDLRGALKRDGRNDRVICLYDDLSFGPINPPDPDARHRWVAETLGFTGWPETEEGSFPWRETAFGDVQWDDVPVLSRTFWSEALAIGPRKVLWMSRRTPQEYAGWLEWIWRAGDQPCDVVDLTDLPGEEWEPESDFEEHPGPDYAKQLELLGHARPLTAAVRKEARELWEQLRAEDAPFRVINDGRLASAPITAFDERLLAGARPHWRKVSFVVATAWLSESDDRVVLATDMVLAARVKKMIDDGRLETEGGDPFTMRFCSVRLRRDGSSFVSPADSS
jgi:hypothetical protein